VRPRAGATAARRSRSGGGCGGGVEQLVLERLVDEAAHELDQPLLRRGVGLGLGRHLCLELALGDGGAGARDLRAPPVELLQRLDHGVDRGRRPLRAGVACRDRALQLHHRGAAARLDEVGLPALELPLQRLRLLPRLQQAVARLGAARLELGEEPVVILRARDGEEQLAAQLADLALDVLDFVHPFPP
jgi:hypothetical protein